MPTMAIRAMISGTLEMPSVSDQLSVTLAPTTSKATMMKKANFRYRNSAITSRMPRMAAM